MALPILVTEQAFNNKMFIFKDRCDAGRQLAKKLEHHKGSSAVVMAIPSGGIPVGLEIARYLGVLMDLVIVRKIQIPWNTEAGFGAMNLDGDIVLNDELLGRLSLSDNIMNKQTLETLDILERRERSFRQGRPLPPLEGKTVILADDGLASGYTMQAAITFVKKRNSQKVVVAVPTGPISTVNRVLPEVDELVCLNIRTGRTFAVADAYTQWHDLTDTEVLKLLSSS